MVGVDVAAGADKELEGPREPEASWWDATEV